MLTHHRRDLCSNQPVHVLSWVYFKTNLSAVLGNVEGSLFNKSRPSQLLLAPGLYLKEKRSTLCGCALRVFSACDFQSPRVLITATLLWLIPSDPPASISPNQISLVGLFIIAGSDCEWCLANGFSIQICRLDAPESQQGLSFLWRRRLRSGVNKEEMTLLKYAFVVVLVFFLGGGICIDF